VFGFSPEFGAFDRSGSWAGRASKLIFPDSWPRAYPHTGNQKAANCFLTRAKELLPAVKKDWIG
jgi:hypothetical protein